MFGHAVDGTAESHRRLKNFFQYLCQAVVKVEKAALVASLLATDPEKSDERGKQMKTWLLNAVPYCKPFQNTE